VKPVIGTLERFIFLLAVAMSDEQVDGDADDEGQYREGNEDCFEEDFYEAHLDKLESVGVC